MLTALYILLALLGVGVVYWLVRLIWLKPLDINHLYMRLFIELLWKDPETLTMLGILEQFGLQFHNDDLTDASEEYRTKLFKQMRRGLTLLRSYNRSHQNKMQLISTDILDWFIGNELAVEPFRYHNYPVNQMFGVQSSLPNFMMTLHPLKTKRDARNYIKRLGKFDKKLGQVLDGLKIREQAGIIPPRFVIRRVLEEMSAFIGKPAQENPLYTVFNDKLAKIKMGDTDRAQLLQDAAQAIERVIYPAYQKLIDYFSALEPRATDDDGVWKFPDGERYYAYELRSNTSTDMSPEEVHTTGVNEVERIEGEMKTILAGLGYKDVNLAQQMLAFGQEERFQYPNSDEGRAAALAEFQKILDHISQNLDNTFDLRPKAGLKVERVPEFREKTSAGAYYMPASMDGSRPGVFYANLRDMKEVEKFGMKTNAYHEGIPGHHFQIAIAQRLKDVPFFRRLVPFTAYAEGWALYAEKLARELGFYKDDPYGELGALSAELFRAVRLVVDTGIHHKKWTRQQAIDYMEAHTGSPHASVVSEIERYIVMPGQACAYKIGEIKILALRAKARRALGDKFDLRQFHNVVLKNGSMPLSILEQVVDAYIASVQAA